MTNTQLNPTVRDAQVYDFIVRYKEAHTFAPTLEEIATDLKTSRQNIHTVINRLVKMGCVLRESKQIRGLVPVKSPLTLIR